jgi:hypothetical protein
MTKSFQSVKPSITHIPNITLPEEQIGNPLPPNLARQGVQVTKSGRGRKHDRGIDALARLVALELFTQAGLSALSVGEICHRAKIPRVSFYRRWKNAAEIVADAFVVSTRIEPLPDKGNHLGDLIEFGERLNDVFAEPQIRPCAALLITEAVLRPE